MKMPFTIHFFSIIPILIYLLLSPQLRAETQKDFAARLSPDDQRLIYYSYRGDQLPDIFISDAQGRKETNLTNTQDLWEIEPTFSPSGKTIVFARGTSMKSMQVFSMAPDGSHIQQLTHKKGTNSGPKFSPDGQFLLHHQFFGAERAYIHKIDLHTGKSTQLTGDNLYATSPSYSPDGKQIVFINKDQETGRSDIYMMNADGSHKTQLTKDETKQRNAIFSRDGRHLIVTQETDNKPSGLYLYSLSGKQIKLLVQSDTQHSYFASLSSDGQTLLHDKGDWSADFFIYQSDMSANNQTSIQLTGVDKVAKEEAVFNKHLGPFVGTWQGHATEGRSAGHFSERTTYSWGPNRRSLKVDMQIFWDGNQIDQGVGIMGVDINTGLAYFHLTMSDGGLITQRQRNAGNSRHWEMDAKAQGTNAYPASFKTELTKQSKDTWQSAVLLKDGQKWSRVSVHQFTRITPDK